MKKHIPGFLAGVLVTTALLGTAAASGALTLSVTPVNIKVNGEVFQPKDVNGDDVMVFAYNGTTYAPLRALAEAYGLQVGWDQASGTATVVDPDAEQVAPDTTANAYADWTAEEEAAYQEFKGMWEGEMHEEDMLVSFCLTDGKLENLQSWMKNTSDERLKKIVIRHVSEFAWTDHNYPVTSVSHHYWSSKPAGTHNGSTCLISGHIFKMQPNLNKCSSVSDVIENLQKIG